MTEQNKLWAVQTIWLYKPSSYTMKRHIPSASPKRCICFAGIRSTSPPLSHVTCTQFTVYSLFSLGENANYLVRSDLPISRREARRYHRAVEDILIQVRASQSQLFLHLNAHLDQFYSSRLQGFLQMQNGDHATLRVVICIIGNPTETTYNIFVVCNELVGTAIP